MDFSSRGGEWKEKLVVYDLIRWIRNNRFTLVDRCKLLELGNSK
jgi:hypothetical protein